MCADRFLQMSIDDLGTYLSEARFCVVDLETTGGREATDITEIAAMTICGGEVISDFSTLVRPRARIPAHIQLLTGITNEMVADAPPIEAVLPSFLEFSRGTILIAHNANFDVGFLKRACAQFDYPWPHYPVLDTLSLARRIIPKAEIGNYKLATLSQFFAVKHSPTHRALDDVAATVEVFHGLCERVGNCGVQTVEDLLAYSHRVSKEQRSKKAWSDTAPQLPGVYWFYFDHPGSSTRPGRREILYVGKSVNLRSRTRSYFTSSETRSHITEMVRLASGMDYVVCETGLESEVRELRLIESHLPRYNRRSKRQRTICWVKLTDEAFPRLSIVRKRGSDGYYLGPFSTRATATEVQRAIWDAFPIRQCTHTIPGPMASSCPVGELGRCLKPCEHPDCAEDYAEVANLLRALFEGDVTAGINALGARIGKLASQERFEEAQTVSRRLETLLEASHRTHRLRGLVSCPEIIATKATDAGWDIHVIRYGRLAHAVRVGHDDNPPQVARRLRDLAEVVPAPPMGLPAGSVEEAERIAAWMESGVRLLDLDGVWSEPRLAQVSHPDLVAMVHQHWDDVEG